jgi:2-C-methyl-D-erythritol 4-phosphate cytidylyltransferase
MGSGIDKIFLEINGEPVISHTWRRFEECRVVDEIVLVVREGLQEAFHEIATIHRFGKSYRVVTGGAERQDSVWNGLEAVSPNSELVSIHDGARPCVTPRQIETCLDAARAYGAAVLAQRAVDTIKESDGGNQILRHLDRSRLWSVQTPQCFRTATIRRALQAIRESGALVTDDTAACAAIGQSVILVQSDLPNPKVTSPADLDWVEFQLARQEALAKGKVGR